jgi:predicted DCC family thiol-disulfide oxidoreductase YuxK
MFGLFKKKTKEEKLQELYREHLERSYKLSTTDRAESDRAYAEAQAVLKEIEALEHSK